MIFRSLADMLREHTVYGKWMCLDVGDKCIGVALSDAQGVVACACGALKNKNGVLDKICDIVRESDVGVIVVGWPLEMSGREGRQCEKVNSFVVALESVLIDCYSDFGCAKCCTHIPAIVLFDERYSTRAVMGVMRSANLTRKKRTVHKDVCAAIYILQIALDMRGFY